MERIFNYSILTAVPDPRRGERVNVGMIVFLPDRLDVRFSDLNKLRALTGHDWSNYVEEAKDRLSKIYTPEMKPLAFNERLETMETVIHPTDTGWFGVDGSDDYESRIAEILTSLVKRPHAERQRRWYVEAERSIGAAAPWAGAGCLPWQHDDWRPWFAWRPVVLNDGRTAWLRTVRRRWQEAILHGWEYAAP